MQFFIHLIIAVKNNKLNNKEAQIIKLSGVKVVISEIVRGFLIEKGKKIPRVTLKTDIQFVCLFLMLKWFFFSPGDENDLEATEIQSPDANSYTERRLQ